MRLLKCENGKFSLTKDLVGVNIPLYAILSHTWGPDSEEVTYQDMVHGSGKDKTGYKKIRFCADQAQRHGLLYFWIDTCCIDKANHAELAEAINSMFRWYRNAARCYVYLSDISTAGCESGLLPSSPPSWEPGFRTSRWFTRGWTLQELLAPASVQFFTQDSTLLGDKISLYRQIHEITGIPVSALRGDDLSSFDVDERFRWAESRETTREEDWAYSLLGIFGVFIPPIYGEGKENAVRRLRSEVRSTLGKVAPGLVSSDCPAFAIGFSLSEVIEAENFVAREEELCRIWEVLGQGSERRTAVVHGLGGMGKTQLAVAYAKRHRHDYSAVFWLNARDDTTLKQGFARAAERILREHSSVVYVANAVQNRNLDEAVVAVKRWLDQPKNDRWLIIYDNYDNPALNKDRANQPTKPDGDMNTFTQSYDIRPFLPDTYHGTILITTRSAKVKLGHQITLRKLKNLKDSLDILANTSNREDLQNGM
jgi:hypothetical protein